MMPTTPGKAACASAAAKIHPRTNPETRLPTLSFSVIVLFEKPNPVLPKTKMSAGQMVLLRCSFLTREYAGKSICAEDRDMDL
jgi:hypothetical protein